MDPRLHALAGRQAGAFSTTEARRLGVPGEELRRASAAGELVRARRGAYVSAAVWRAAADDQRYRLRCLAIARSRPGDVLTHHAALAIHGLPLWSHDPSRVDLLTGVRQSVRRGQVWLHPEAGVDGAIELVDGVPVVSIARALVRTSLTAGRDCAVVAGDAALHARLVTPEQLRAELALVTMHEGRRRALEAVESMSGKAESVGESRTRLILDDLGFAHESQYVIRDEAGQFLARVDFLVEGVVLEFDGRTKYQRKRDVDDGRDLDPGQIVWLEKRREDGIRRRGYPVERVIWDDLARPGLIGARIREAGRWRGGLGVA